MRAVAVSRGGASRPLLRRRRPSGAFGGGKSLFCGINLQLQGGLVGFAAEVGKQVANRLLTGVDDVTGRGLVDGVSDAAAEFFEAATQALQESIRGEWRQGGHRGSGGWGKETARSGI